MTDDDLAMLQNPERMASIKRGVEQAKRGEVTSHTAEELRAAYIEEYGGAPEDVSQPDTDNAVTHDESVITITISRNCAEYFAERACTNDRACFTEVGGCVALDCHLEQACRAALEGEK